MNLIIKRRNQNPETIGVFDWKNIDGRDIEYIQLNSSDDPNEGPKAITKDGQIYFMIKSQATFEGSRTLYGIGEYCRSAGKFKIRWYDDNLHGQEVEERESSNCVSGIKHV